MPTAKRPCPICSSSEAVKLHTQKFILPDGHPLSEGYDVVSCDQCGFVYADTSVTQDEYDRFYSQFSKYEDKKTGTGGIENQWDRDRLTQTAKDIASFLNNDQASILDVGCANGGLLKAMMDLGYDHVLGIDPSPICVANTQALGVRAQIGSLNKALEQEKFDCIILSHTLEHIQDLRTAAEWILAASKPSSTLYVEVPDAARYKDFVDAPFQDFNTEHINHFSTTCLKNFLSFSGFKPLSWGEKIIPASSNKPYPAIFCFAKVDARITDITKDESLSSSIETYIQRSRKILDEINTRISTALTQNKRIIVWGTGQLVMKLLVETTLANAEIIAFVDNNPINQGKMFRGIKILAPDQIDHYSEPILISSTLHQQAIVEQISEMGIKNPLILLK